MIELMQCFLHPVYEYRMCEWSQSIVCANFRAIGICVTELVSRFLLWYVVIVEPGRILESQICFVAFSFRCFVAFSFRCFVIAVSARLQTICRLQFQTLCRLQFQTLCRLQFQMPRCLRGFSKASDDLSPSVSDALSPSVSDASPVEHTVNFEPSKYFNILILMARTFTVRAPMVLKERHCCSYFNINFEPSKKEGKCSSLLFKLFYTEICPEYGCSGMRGRRTMSKH
jgi:hypothetical protein